MKKFKTDLFELLLELFLYLSGFIVCKNLKKFFFHIPVYFCFKIGQIAFKGTKALNRIQSVVFPAAYKTNENLLICAPTGAGKTNIAMLTILHELKQHISQGVIKKDEFKVNISLQWLGTSVLFNIVLWQNMISTKYLIH